jgi:hypothetical protein
LLSNTQRFQPLPFAIKIQIREQIKNLKKQSPGFLDNPGKLKK